MKVKLVKLNICTCGFPLLDDSILLGAEYTIFPETIRDGFYFKCGGCGKEQSNLICVNTTQKLHPNRPPAPLPLEIFDYQN